MKFVILKSGGGELANQLWNFASVYAHALEVGATVRNPAFFEYHYFFNFLPKESLFTRFVAIFFRSVRRRAHPINRSWRLCYAVLNKVVSGLHSSCVISSQNTTNAVTYLPPTKPFALPRCNTAYFSGWLFRNPEGLKKHRTELLQAFAPRADIQKKVSDISSSLRADHAHTLGIHLRQGDYKVFKGGKYLLSAGRMREIVDEYLAQRGWVASDVALVITSDGPVDMAAFQGFTAHRSSENAVADLFLLSKTDAVIGSDSSFGNFAAWYGDIPHIVATKDGMDWPYYAGKTAYFPNKYATLVQQ